MADDLGTLERDADALRLTFTRRLAHAPEKVFRELGKAVRDAAGWHTCLDLLDLHLDARTPPWTQPERWKQVHIRYVESLGPEAATIGPPDSKSEYQ